MVWYASQLLKVYNSLDEAIRAAVESGFTGIMPKIANGNYAWLPGKPEAQGLPELIALARENNLKVHTWMYSYGQDLVGELAAIKAAYGIYGGDSFTINAEAEYKRKGAGVVATNLTTRLRAELSGVTLGYTSYRFPTKHGEWPPGAGNGFPFREFQAGCDFAMPQLYFVGAHNPAEQLETSKREYDALPASRPYVPIGSGYNTAVWTPTPADLDELDAKAHELGLKAISWWRWDTAVFLGLWPTIAAHYWPVTQPPQKIHWSQASASLKDYVLYRAAQQLGLVDGYGYILIEPPEVFVPISIRLRRTIQSFQVMLSGKSE